MEKIGGPVPKNRIVRFWLRSVTEHSMRWWAVMLLDGHTGPVPLVVVKWKPNIILARNMADNDDDDLQAFNNNLQVPRLTPTHF